MRTRWFGSATVQLRWKLATNVPMRCFAEIEIVMSPTSLIMLNARSSFPSTPINSVRNRRSPWQVSSLQNTLENLILILRHWEPHYLNKQRLMLVFESVSWTTSKVKTDTDISRTWFIWQSAGSCFTTTGIASQKRIFLSTGCKSGLHSLICSSGASTL